ncbi:MAG TPA: shikimate dehydrogenase [Geobacteraceae bacterium]
MQVTGTTRVLGIIGSPIAHSLSPLMQNAALAELGLDFVYVPFAVAPDQLDLAVSGLRTLGVTGFNVTIPHKETILPLLDEITPQAMRMGAVNTVQRVGDRLVGHNTDGAGLLAALAADLDFTVAGKRVLILGAGGAARAAVMALLDAGAAAVTIANRDLARGEALMGMAVKQGGAGIMVAPLAILASAELGGYDLLLNATSVGMNGTTFVDFCPELLNDTACVYDMVYAPLETPLLRSARQAGRRTANGLGMLAAQGERAFVLWTGCQPPPGVMRTVLLTRLAG